jgi:hypothetical protein
MRKISAERLRLAEQMAVRAGPVGRERSFTARAAINISSGASILHKALQSGRRVIKIPSHLTVTHDLQLPGFIMRYWLSDLAWGHNPP